MRRINEIIYIHFSMLSFEIKCVIYIFHISIQITHISSLQQPHMVSGFCTDPVSSSSEFRERFLKCIKCSGFPFPVTTTLQSLSGESHIVHRGRQYKNGLCFQTIQDTHLDVQDNPFDKYLNTYFVTVHQ